MFFGNNGMTFGSLAVSSVMGCSYCSSNWCEDPLKSIFIPIRMPTLGSLDTESMCKDDFKGLLAKLLQQGQPTYASEL